MNVRERAIRFLFGGVIDAAVEARLASISARVDDSPGWDSLNQAPGDRSWSEKYSDLQDGLEAWRKNFLIRRIVNLVRSYVVGGGITITSRNPEVQAFIEEFWKHRKNKMERRLGPICDQITRDGELFPILFTNSDTGISYIRFRTAQQIRGIETLKNDYEEERRYVENDGTASGKLWYAVGHPSALRKRSSGKLPPVMLHWAVNQPIDATRGESDLTPILPWAKRYGEWLKDRVRLNRQRTKQAMMLVQVADDSLVKDKRNQLRQTNPTEAGIYVYGSGETVTYPNLQIRSDDAAEDGRVLRLAVASGSNIGMHYLGEGEGTNYATAQAMGEPTARFYSDRQQELIWMLEDLIAVAYIRYCLILNCAPVDDLELAVNVTEVAREDNESLARAAHSIAQALAIGAAEGWMDDETALIMMMKFAGESLSKEDIERIMREAKIEDPSAESGSNGQEQDEVDEVV